MHYGFQDRRRDRRFANWMDEKGYARIADFGRTGGLAKFTAWQHLTSTTSDRQDDQGCASNCGCAHIAWEDTSPPGDRGVCALTGRSGAYE